MGRVRAAGEVVLSRGGAGAGTVHCAQETLRVIRDQVSPAGRVGGRNCFEMVLVSDAFLLYAICRPVELDSPEDKEYSSYMQL